MSPCDICTTCVFYALKGAAFVSEKVRSSFEKTLE